MSHDKLHHILNDHTNFPGGSTNFLREDGTWAAPGGGPGGSSAPGLLGRRLAATDTYDEQFDGSSLANFTTIDNVPRCDIDESYDTLSFTVKATGAAKELSCVLKSIPTLAVGDYIEGAFTHHGHNQYHSAALILSDGTTFGTSDQEVVMCYWNTASDIKARLNPINNFNADAGSGTEKSLGPQEGLYGIRLKWEATNTFGLYISHNGKRWLAVQTNHARTLTPTHAGVGLLHYDSAANWGQIDWHYFAYNLA